jgi:hypothetical protein
MTLRVLFHLYRAPVVKSWRIAVCATASEEGQNRRSRVLVLDGSGAADAELLLQEGDPG